MLVFYVGLALWAIVATFRSVRRPLDTSLESVAAAEKMMRFCWKFLFGAVAAAMYALVSGKYYLLFASLFFFCIVLPMLVQYLRLKIALKNVNSQVGR